MKELTKYSHPRTAHQLPVMEHFYTIQGEGSYSGRAAYFVRLSGCDVGCVWCDVKESWTLEEDQWVEISEIIRWVLDAKAEFVVITGGEPATYPLHSLVNQLKQNGIEVGIETSGVFELQENIDWICFSPKKFKPPVAQMYDVAHELKVVISHPSDFSFAEQHAQQMKNKGCLFLQPEWSKQERMLPEIIDYVKNNPKWRISLQTHKFMQIP